MLDRVTKKIPFLVIWIVIIFPWCIYRYFSGDEIFNEDALFFNKKLKARNEVPSIIRLNNSNEIIINGFFEECSQLSGSSFDTETTFLHHIFNATSLESLVKTVKIIEETALQIEKSIFSRYEAKKASQLDVRRFSCYSAALGINSFYNITSSSFLKHVDRKNYFLSSLPSVIPLTQIETNRQYKIAYFIMVKNGIGLESIKHVIDILDDGLAIFLIHIDKKYANIDQRSLGWLASRKNVFRTKNSISGQWGHSSLVFIEMNGFFELLDLARWDYVINLSGMDFPFRRNQDIHDYLQAPERINHTWVQYYCGSIEDKERRLHSLTFKLSKLRGQGTRRSGIRIKQLHRPMYQFDHYCKGSQWMILDRTTVQDIRNEQKTFDLLAFMEHTWIPDESFFPNLIENDEQKASRNFKDDKRFIQWNVPKGVSAPKFLTIDDRKDFDTFIISSSEYSNPKYLFARKIADPELIEWISSNHLNIKESEVAVQVRRQMRNYEAKPIPNNICPLHLSNSPMNILYNPEDSGVVLGSGAAKDVDIPNTIWTFWEGQDLGLTILMQAFVENWKRYNPKNEFIILTLESLKKYTPNSKIPSSIPLTNHELVKNWAKLAVLNENGGIWIDTNIILTESLSFIHDTIRMDNSDGFAYYIDKYTHSKDLPFYEFSLLASVKRGTFISALYNEFINGITENSYLEKLTMEHPEQYKGIITQIDKPEWNILQIAARKIMLIDKVNGLSSIAAEHEPHLLRKCLGWWETKPILQSILDPWEGEIPRVLQIMEYEKAELMQMLSNYPISTESIYYLHVLSPNTQTKERDIINNACPTHLFDSSNKTQESTLHQTVDFGTIKSPGNISTSIPHVIWTYLNSEVSFIVQDILDNWATYNPDHNIVVLTMANIHQYVKENNIPKVVFSNNNPTVVEHWMRLAVLKEHGGIWLDSPIILTRSLSFIHDIQHSDTSEGFAYYLANHTLNTNLPYYEPFVLASIKNGKFISSLYKEYNIIFDEGLTELSYLEKLNATYPNQYPQLVARLEKQAERNIFQILARKILLIDGVKRLSSIAAEYEPHLLRMCLGWRETRLIFKALFDPWVGPIPRVIKIMKYEEFNLQELLADPNHSISNSSIYFMHVRPHRNPIRPTRALGTYLQKPTLNYYNSCNQLTKYSYDRYYKAKEEGENRGNCPIEFLESLVDVDMYPPIRAAPIKSSSVNVEWIIFTTTCNMGTNRLVKSITDKGIPLTILGYDRPFIGFGQRIRMIYDYLSTIPDARTVIITDSKDVILVPGCTIEEILKSYASFKTPILFSSDAACFPYPIASLYADPLNTTGRFSPFKYLNAGIYMGEAEAIMALIQHAYVDDCIDDQGRFSLAHVHNLSYADRNPWRVQEMNSTETPLTKLDWYNSIFMTISSIKASEFDFSSADEKRIFYPQTNASVCILHQSGPKTQNRALEEISKKLGMDYDRVIDGENYYSNI